MQDGRRTISAMDTKELTPLRQRIPGADARPAQTAFTGQLDLEKKANLRARQNRSLVVNGADDRQQKHNEASRSPNHARKFMTQ